MNAKNRKWMRITADGWRCVSVGIVFASMLSLRPIVKRWTNEKSNGTQTDWTCVVTLQRCCSSLRRHAGGQTKIEFDENLPLSLIHYFGKQMNVVGEMERTKKKELLEKREIHCLRLSVVGSTCVFCCCCCCCCSRSSTRFQWLWNTFTTRRL